jgi:Transposase Tn5 dimerisation domain/Transposase DNA-binding
MQEWVEKEISTVSFPTKNRKKLEKRFRKVLDAMSRKPSLKFTASCKGRAEVAGAYRFVDHEDVTAAVVLAPHRDATIQRIREHPVVLIPQDTTEIDVTRPHEVMVGSGPLNDSSRVGFHDHASVAMTPERVGLGVVDAQIWARDFEEFEKDAAQKRAERRAKSIEEKESVRWVEGYRQACRVAQEAPATQIVSIADSEGDIYEYIWEGRRVKGVRKAEFIIRACQDRALAPDEDTSPKSQAKLREQVARMPVLTKLTLKVRAREPKSKDKRKRKQPREARTATVTVQAMRVKLRGPDRPGGRLEDVEVNAVLVSEPNPPPGAEPIEWLLLTNLPIRTVTQILTIIKYYTCRWYIEIYFRILKSGCKVEESQLERAERFLPYLALCMIVAWRVQFVMMLGRECPDLPCDVAFEDEEWQAVYAVVMEKPPPPEPPSMKMMVGMIGTLGGWLGRKCDGEPGPKAIWVGLQRMMDLGLAWRAFAAHGPGASKGVPGG